MLSGAICGKNGIVFLTTDHTDFRDKVTATASLEAGASDPQYAAVQLEQLITRKSAGLQNPCCDDWTVDWCGFEQMQIADGWLF